MPQMQRLPNRIYELLPLIYFICGILIAYKLENEWGVFSGLMLGSAGILVWWSRRRYRKATQRIAATRAQDTLLNTQMQRRKSGLMQLVWSREYECGHAGIDAQHRKLFALSNALLNAILEKKPKLDVELHLDELIHDMAKHFKSEETLLKRMSHPVLDEHSEHHRSLLASCKTMAARFHQDEIKAGELFQFVAFEVVSGHILKEDSNFDFPEESEPAAGPVK